jgi:hypothetical protein
MGSGCIACQVFQHAQPHSLPLRQQHSECVVPPLPPGFPGCLPTAQPLPAPFELQRRPLFCKPPDQIHPSPDASVCRPCPTLDLPIMLPESPIGIHGCPHIGALSIRPLQHVTEPGLATTDILYRCRHLYFLQQTTRCPR